MSEEHRIACPLGPVPLRRSESRPAANPLKVLHKIWLLARIFKNEILGITWERGELDKDLGFNARITLYETKNGEPGGIPLNTAVGAALTTRVPDPGKREGRVFKRKDGSGRGQIRKGFEKAVEWAGLSDFRFHDLRHTAASHLAMRGRPLKEIQEILGHKSFSMTFGHAHLSPMHLCTTVESPNGLSQTRHSLTNGPIKWHKTRRTPLGRRVPSHSSLNVLCAPVAQSDRASAF